MIYTLYIYIYIYYRLAEQKNTTQIIYLKIRIIQQIEVLLSLVLLGVFNGVIQIIHPLL